MDSVNFVPKQKYIPLYLNLYFDFSILMKELDAYLKQNGCKSIFLLAKDAEKSDLELDSKSLSYLADKLLHFIDYLETTGVKIEPKEVVDSVVRLMPCIKAVRLLNYGNHHRIRCTAVKRVSCTKNCSTESTIKETKKN